jgi:hypothetical protein
MESVSQSVSYVASENYSLSPEREFNGGGGRERRQLHNEELSVIHQNKQRSRRKETIA